VCVCVGVGVCVCVGVWIVEGCLGAAVNVRVRMKYPSSTSCMAGILPSDGRYNKQCCHFAYNSNVT
jgi:hypothetical protein